MTILGWSVSVYVWRFEKLILLNLCVVFKLKDNRQGSIKILVANMLEVQCILDVVPDMVYIWTILQNSLLSEKIKKTQFKALMGTGKLFHLSSTYSRET